MGWDQLSLVGFRWDGGWVSWAFKLPATPQSPPRGLHVIVKLFLESGSYSVTQTVLGLMAVHLPQPSMYWGCHHVLGLPPWATTASSWYYSHKDIKYTAFHFMTLSMGNVCCHMYLMWIFFFLLCFLYLETLPLFPSLKQGLALLVMHICLNYIGWSSTSGFKWFSHFRLLSAGHRVPWASVFNLIPPSPPPLPFSPLLLQISILLCIMLDFESQDNLFF